MFVDTSIDHKQFSKEKRKDLFLLKNATYTIFLLVDTSIVECFRFEHFFEKTSASKNFL